MDGRCETCRYASLDPNEIWCMAEKHPRIVYPYDTCERWKPGGMTDEEIGQWEMFESITSAWYGKQYYFLQDDPDIVYSRNSGKYMKRQKAYDEFLDLIGDDGTY